MKIVNVNGDNDTPHLGKIILPNLKNKNSVLQCGARPGQGWKKIFDQFKNNGFKHFDILEIHKPNVDWLKTQSIFKVNNVFFGDIRKIDTYLDLLPTYDVIIFWHGWEHCTLKETEIALPKVMAKCTEAHITGMPWGKWEQSAIKNNPHEKHIHHWYPEQLETLGFDECYTFNAGSKGSGPDKHNVMYAVKYCNK